MYYYTIIYSKFQLKNQALYCIMYVIMIILGECDLKKIFSRNLLKPSDILVIFLTLSLIISTFFIFRPSDGEKSFAVISVDGIEEKTIDLSMQENCIITLETSPVTTLEVKDGAIRFVNSHCPDGTCERSGFLKKVGDTAACVPAKVVVTVKGSEKPDIDAVAG